MPVYRGLRDYGTGAMGDMGAHIFDAPIWALNLGLPTKIQAVSSPYSVDYMPQCEVITYEFAAPELVPADKTFIGPDPWLARTGNIFEDWIGAIKAGKKSCNDFSISGKLTEIMLLTNIALQSKASNTTLEYDSVNMKITNVPDANKLLHYEYRTGWTL